jgi:hypothetical protein
VELLYKDVQSVPQRIFAYLAEYIPHPSEVGYTDTSTIWKFCIIEGCAKSFFEEAVA